MDDFLTKCKKKDLLYKAIHIEKSTKDPVYEDSSSRVDAAYAFE